MVELHWDRTNPFIVDVVVSAESIDGYGHVSNYHFLKWMTDCAFAHSTAVGLPETTCRELGRGMAVRDISLQLIGSAYEGNRLQVGNWISRSDGKLRASRQFQIINETTGKTLARADIDFVCTNLDTGRPVKMPEVFARTYIVESVPIENS